MPPQRAVKPTPESLTAVSDPRTMENSMGATGPSTGGCGHCTITDPLRNGTFLAQPSGTVPLSTRGCLLPFKLLSYEALGAIRQPGFLWMERPLNSYAAGLEANQARHRVHFCHLARLVGLMIMTTMSQPHFNKSPPGSSKTAKNQGGCPVTPQAGQLRLGSGTRFLHVQSPAPCARLCEQQKSQAPIRWPGWRRITVELTRSNGL